MSRSWILVIVMSRPIWIDSSFEWDKRDQFMFCFSNSSPLITNGTNSKCLALVLAWTYTVGSSARNDICNKVALLILFFCSYLSTSGNKTKLYGVECGIFSSEFGLSARAKPPIMLFTAVMKLKSHYVIIWMVYFFFFKFEDDFYPSFLKSL
jgi:hypothetical protein